MTTALLHLVGSAESEFLADLSCLYARDCLQEIGAQDAYRSQIAYVSPDRRWRFVDDLRDATIAAAPAVEIAEAIDRLQQDRPDAMVPQMFCQAGMTEYRALFDVLGIPYLGNRPDTMALGAHKPRAKAVVAAAGVPVPEAIVVGDGDPIPSGLQLPVVVKPVDGDNSVGTSLVTQEDELPGAVAAALAHASAAMLERYVEPGREVRCGVLDQDGELICLPLEEYAVDAAHKPIRDEADKLARDESGRLGLVAKDAAHAWIVDPSDPICAPVRDAARACHRALGCRHYGLFDFRIDRDDRPWFLEAGLYCSFARQSVIATMARAAGIDAQHLFADVLAATLQGTTKGRSL